MKFNLNKPLVSLLGLALSASALAEDIELYVNHDVDVEESQGFYLYLIPQAVWRFHLTQVLVVVSMKVVTCIFLAQIAVLLLQRLQ